MLIEGWLELKKKGVMGSRWSRQWGEIRDRVLIYSKTEHHQHNRDASHASMSSLGGGEEMMNPLQAASQNNFSQHDNIKEKNIPLNGGSVELLDDHSSFVFTPSIGTQITMRCPDRNAAQKWVHAISVALSQETWNAYVDGQNKQKSSPTRLRSPSAHAMVASGSATQQSARSGGVISHGGPRGRRIASGSMSDNDIT